MSSATKASYIFILRLVGNRYFVGRSRNVKERIRAHFEGRGSEWTKQYRPISVLRIFKSRYIEERDMWTKRLMNQYSIDQVRGGSYVRIELTAEERTFIQKEIRGAKDQCFACGSNQHFIRDCPQRYSLHRGILQVQSQQDGCSRHRSSPNHFRVPFQRREPTDRKQPNDDFGNDESYYEPQRFQGFFQIDQDNFEDYWNQLYIESDENEILQQPRQQDQSQSIYCRQPERQENSQERFSSYMSDFIESSSSLGSFINDQEEIVDSYESSEYGLSNLNVQQEDSIVNRQNQSISVALAAGREESQPDSVVEEEIINKYLVRTYKGQPQEEVDNCPQGTWQFPRKRMAQDLQSESEQINCIRKRRKRSQASEAGEEAEPERLQRLKVNRNDQRKRQLLMRKQQQSHFDLSKMKKIKAFLASAEDEEEPTFRCLRKLRKI